MMPRQERVRLLLRALGKFLAVVVVAGGVGALLGIGISKLSSDDEPQTAIAPDTTSPTPEPSAGAAVSDATASTPAPASQDPLEQISVTVLFAVLHPAATPSGIRRRRARLGVRVKVTNRGSRRVVPARPSLLAARQRTPTNPHADRPGSRLGPIAAGKTVDVTLRFETAGAVTQQLTTQRRARVLVAGRSWPVRVTVGPPVRSSEGSENNFP